MVKDDNVSVRHSQNKREREMTAEEKRRRAKMKERR